MINDIEELCTCIEDEIQKGKNLADSFNSCLKKSSEDLKYRLMSITNSCDEFVKYMKNIRNVDICQSIHHYLTYLMAKRCIKFSNILINFINTITNNIDNICKLLDTLYSMYVDSIITNFLKKLDINRELELAIMCDIFSRIQLYCLCVDEKGLDECADIKNSVISRIQVLL